jgi:multisubunit Na+/H+ antiporter MnhB subunit
MIQHTPSERYQNMLIMSAGFTILGLAFGWEPLLWVALVLAVSGLSSGWLSDRLIYGWHKLGHALGYVNSRIILSVIFIVVLTPVALLYRATRKKVAHTGSYFVTRNYTYTAKDMEKGW